MSFQKLTTWIKPLLALLFALILLGALAFSDPGTVASTGGEGYGGVSPSRAMVNEAFGDGGDGGGCGNCMNGGENAPAPIWISRQQRHEHLVSRYALRLTGTSQALGTLGTSLQMLVRNTESGSMIRDLNVLELIGDDFIARIHNVDYLRNLGLQIFFDLGASTGKQSGMVIVSENGLSDVFEWSGSSIPLDLLGNLGVPGTLRNITILDETLSEIAELEAMIDSPTQISIRVVIKD